VKTTIQLAAAFADIKPILDQCLAHGGGTYEATSPGSAVQFRHRCYTFRKQWREALLGEASPYDRLTIKKLAKGATRVEIVPLRASGTFTPAQGEAIVDLSEDDPLLAEAEALRFKLDL
jgi:hypothetical protein